VCVIVNNVYNKFDLIKFFLLIILMFDELLSYNLIDYDKIIFNKKLDKGNLIVYKGIYNNNDI